MCETSDFQMNLKFDKFLCWILIRSAEIYYGDSLKELSIKDS